MPPGPVRRRGGRWSDGPRSLYLRRRGQVRAGTPPTHSFLLIKFHPVQKSIDAATSPPQHPFQRRGRSSKCCLLYPKFPSFTLHFLLMFPSSLVLKFLLSLSMYSPSSPPLPSVFPSHSPFFLHGFFLLCYLFSPLSIPLHFLFLPCLIFYPITLCSFPKLSSSLVLSLPLTPLPAPSCFFSLLIPSFFLANGSLCRHA